MERRAPTARTSRTLVDNAAALHEALDVKAMQRNAMQITALPNWRNLRSTRKAGGRDRQDGAFAIHRAAPAGTETELDLSQPVLLQQAGITADD